jgi:hypothetical protein
MSDRPSSSWPWLSRPVKRFLREFVGVTLGVLLALVLEQAVAEWRERQRVGDTRASMNEEVADFAEIFELRRRVDPCIRTKLDQLDAFLDEKGPDRKLHDIGRPPYYFASRGAWNSNAGDQMARHFGAAVLKRYGEIYQGMTEFASLSKDEQGAWARLQVLEGDSGALGPDRRARLREIISEARNTNLLMSATAEQMVTQAKNVGVSRNRTLAARKIESEPICRELAVGAGA